MERSFEYLNSFIIVITLLVILMIPVIVYKNITQKVMLNSDFVNYFTGARILKSNERNNIYDIKTQIKYQNDFRGIMSVKNLPFRMLPIIAILFLPLTYVDYFIGYKIWLLINLILGVVAYYLMTKECGIKKPYLGLILLLCLPVLGNVLLGQVVFIFLIVLIYVYKYLKVENVFAAGLLCSLLIIRVQYLLFIPTIFLKIDKKKEFLKGFLLGILFVFSFSVILIGFRGLLSYPSFLIMTETSDFGSNFRSFQSIYPYLREFFGNLEWIFFIDLILNFVLYGIFLLFFSSKKKNISLEAAVSLGVVSTLIFGLHIYIHDLVLLLIPLFIIVGRFVSKYRIFLFTLSFMILLLPYIIRYIGFHFLIPILMLVLMIYLLKLPKNDILVQRDLHI